MIEDHGEPSELLNTIERYLTQKCYCDVQCELKESYKFKHRTLLDSGAIVNCIREGLIPSGYFEKPTHKVHRANGEYLRVQYKIPEIYVCIGKTSLMTLVLVVKDLKQGVILGNPNSN